MTLLDILLWGVMPYVTLVVLIGGTIWRYRYDQFGWTTRSSQLYESKLLRIASPMFHVGILVVVVGHVVGLVIPESWTKAAGVTETMYHFMALSLGSIAGVATLGGLALLVYRRRKQGPVFMATTVNDKIMYAVLVVTIVLGLSTTVIAVMQGSHGHNYRESVSPWFRSVFIFQPDIEAMASAPFAFHLHVFVAMCLFMLWPFTRLVHAFTAPLPYLFRPYIVYRSRDARHGRPAKRGWSPVGTRDNARR